MGCVYNFFAPRTREKRCKKNSCSSSSHLCSQSSSTSSSPSSRSSSDQGHLAVAWSLQISRCENQIGESTSFERRLGDAAERVVLGGALGDDPHGCEVSFWPDAFSCSVPCHWGLQGHHHQSHQGNYHNLQHYHQNRYHCHQQHRWLSPSSFLHFHFNEPR